VGGQHLTPEVLQATSKTILPYKAFNADEEATPPDMPKEAEPSAPAVFKPTKDATPPDKGNPRLNFRS